MVGIVTIDGVEDVERMLDGIRRRVKKGAPALAPRIHDFVLVSNRELFDSGGRSAGRPWAAYGSEPKYRAFKQAVLGDLTPLRWKGGKRERLYPSLTQKNDPNHLFRAGSSKVTVGTKLKYADRLHRGGKNMFGETAPARPLAVMAPDRTRRLAQLVAVYVARGTRRGNQWRK